MGMFDSFFYNDNVEFQLKNGECLMNEFRIGDKVRDSGYSDGIYIDPFTRGFVVVFDGIYVAAFHADAIRDKWGNLLDFDRIKECTK